MLAQKVVLFLEYDGVLGPAQVRFGRGSVSTERMTTPWMLPLGPLLQALLAPHMDNVEIVVSNQNARFAPLDGLRAQLPDAVARRVIDGMYLPELSTSVWSDYDSDLATRHACIRLWLERKRPHVADGWLALERGAQADAWPRPDRDHVVWGSLDQPETQDDLRRKLLRLCSGRPLVL
ncbi:hypothetical protein DVT68_00290 [Dyella solisilvae]|uniref:Uncharacterized protein n=2 Tax=Dyella solisilvae TaxID=1920168 RepID=A0A370K9M7_9GAMM|nr:hypothetical protein DVT68_00290 [Dyella solisilvae]